MKKAIITAVVMAYATTCLVGCSSGDKSDVSATEATSTAEATTTTTTTEATTTTTTEETTTETTISRTVTVDSNELEELLAKQPLYVSSTEYVVQDANYKTLYPDLLQAVIMNNSEEDIKDAVVAFVAWDENNLPVKILGRFDYSGGEYIVKCNYSGINLIPGKTYGEDSGMPLDENMNISTFKAIVYSYETFEGTKWTNPYYHAWTQMYGGGKKLTDDMHADAFLTDEDYEEMITKMNESEVIDNASESTDQEN